MRKIITFAWILLFITTVLIGCDKEEESQDSSTTGEVICTSHQDLNNDFICDNCGTELERPSESQPEPVIEITTSKDSLTLKDNIVLKYDYKQLFTITKDGTKVPVVDSYIDTTQVSTDPGTYQVTCTYEGKTAIITVQVITTTYEVILSIEEITIHQTLVDTYDYLALFTAKTDGNVIAITNNMITNNVKAEVGSYEYTVKNNSASKTLIVNVTNDHEIEIIQTYNNVSIHYNELIGYDFTSLFAVYIDGKAVKVEASMIDTTALTDAVEGGVYTITLTCVTDENSLSKSIEVTVIESKELSVVAKNLVIYPNAEYIDLCTLFEIKYGNEIIPVTIDMIEGSINYTSVGINEIVLEYEGDTYTATVEVKKGVVIDYRYSDTMMIMKGTNINTYLFADDFIVVVNGVEMDAIPNSYLDISSVNFNEVGTYPVEISIPYNEDRVGLSGVKFTYYTKTINYVVVQNEYEINILADLVELPVGTTDYNVYKNLKVRINNRNQTLTEVPEYASVISCYVQTISEPIDFIKPGIQEVVVAIYVNGPENDPVYVNFGVVIATDLVVESTDKVVYTGETLYTKDLFTITNAGEIIEVTNEMISGHVDTFTPGVYFVNISYMGIEMTSKVVVLDRYMIGTYKTSQVSIPKTSVDESDEEVTTPGTTLPNLVINEDGTIKIGSKKATIINAIDANTFLVSYGSYKYTLYYNDGIVVLDPDNQIKLEFNDDKRPMVYFSADLWQVMEMITINNKDNHVLVATYPGYTIEAFKLQSNVDYSQKWFGLKVEMTSKMNSDTIYEVSWGEIIFTEDYVNDINQTSAIKLNDEIYKFKFNAKSVAKVYDDTDTKKYANKTFVGNYNGTNATLHVDQNGAYTFLVNDERICYVGIYELGQMKNGGPNFEEDTVLVYDYKNSIFAYKFILDLNTLTFEVEESDGLMAKYQFGEYMFYFDGYGTGIFKDKISSYYEYSFEYSIKGKEIEVNFINQDSDFKYGQTIRLYIDDFGNILTIGSIAYDELIGIVFENQNITDGAIIRVHTTKIGADTDTNAKKRLYESIEIITKDGVVTGDAIKNFVNTSAIRFNTPGFYQFTITVNVNGNDIIGYYGLQVVSVKYDGNEVLGTYTGIVNKNTSIIIDKYGLATINYVGVVYQGLAIINDDNTFYIKAYSNTRTLITLTGELLQYGIISVRATGAATFNEYLTIGNSDVIGCEGFILRLIQIGSQLTFAVSSAKSSFGSFVDLEIIAGDSVFNKDTLVHLTNSEIDTVVRIGVWGNTVTGVLLSDAYRGIYTSIDNTTIFVDGFGVVECDGILGTYDLYRGSIIANIGNETYVYRLNNVDFTYEIYDIDLDNSVVEGMTFTGIYTYYCSDYAYIANTTFEFSANGIVIIKSTSTNHDSGDDECSYDRYAPLFASESGVEGTYSVNGNQLTVDVNGIVFIFKINNVLEIESLITLSSTLDSEAHGYFGENINFIID